MPVEFKDGQTVVHCTGDVLVLPFSPKQEPCKGTAWLLLQEREGGQIGREPKPGQADDPMCLNEQPGVLIAASNYRSLDVIIDALKSLRNDLAAMEVVKHQANGDVPSKLEMYQSGDNKMFVSGLRLNTIETHEDNCRGLVRVCVWPEDVEPFPITGKVVIIDGDLMEVRSVEVMGKIKRGGRIGIIAKPFKKDVDEGLGLS